MNNENQQPKFRQVYRIDSVRLQEYDYSSQGAYFITICTKNHKYFFGNIVNGKIQLSKIGLFVKQYWLEIPNHFPNVTLDKFVIMPNHIHGILFINNRDDATYSRRDAIYRVFAKGGITKNKNPMLHKNLSTIIRSFKGRITFELRQINIDFSWQSSFYDRVIRNECELKFIREYIVNNPLKWEEDKNNNVENLLL